MSVFATSNKHQNEPAHDRVPQPATQERPEKTMLLCTEMFVNRKTAPRKKTIEKLNSKMMR